MAHYPSAAASGSTSAQPFLQTIQVSTFDGSAHYVRRRQKTRTTVLDVGPLPLSPVRLVLWPSLELTPRKLVPSSMSQDMANVPRNVQGSMCLLATPLHRMKQQLREDEQASAAAAAAYVSGSEARSVLHSKGKIGRLLKTPRALALTSAVTPCDPSTGRAQPRLRARRSRLRACACGSTSIGQTSLPTFWGTRCVGRFSHRTYAELTLQRRRPLTLAARQPRDDGLAQALGRMRLQAPFRRGIEEAHAGRGRG